MLPEKFFLKLPICYLEFSGVGIVCFIHDKNNRTHIGISLQEESMGTSQTVLNSLIFRINEYLHLSRIDRTGTIIALYAVTVIVVFAWLMLKLYVLSGSGSSDGVYTDGTDWENWVRGSGASADNSAEAGEPQKRNEKMQIRRLVFRMNNTDSVVIDGRYLGKLCLGGISREIIGNGFSGYSEYFQADHLLIELLPEGNTPYRRADPEEIYPASWYLDGIEEYKYDILCGEAEIDSLEIVFADGDGTGERHETYLFGQEKGPDKEENGFRKRVYRNSSGNLIITLSRERAPSDQVHPGT